MAKSKFVYRGSERTSEDISRKASEGTRDYDSIFKSGIPIFKAKEGENCIRILPSTWDEPDWDYIIYFHRNVGPDEVTYLCLDKMKGEPCPVCEAQRGAADKEEADALRVSKGAICWIIDRDDERTGPQIWQMPFAKVRNEIYARSTDKKTRAPILVDDPEEGFDIVFNRVGTTINTDYKAVEIVRDPSPIHEDQKLQDKWLDYITENPLPSVLHFYEAEHIEKVLFGKKSARHKEEEPEEETGTVRGRRRLATEETEEEAPPRRSRREEAEEPEPEPRSSRLERRRAAVEEEDPPFEGSRRRATRTEEPEEPEPEGRGRSRAQKGEEEESPTTQARASLSRLRDRRRAS